MAPAIVDPSAVASCAAAWRRVLKFTALTIAIGLFLSVLIAPWVAFSWWKVFRRCVSVSAALSLWWVTPREGSLLRRYGLGSWRAGKRHLAFGLALGGGSLAVVFGLGLALGWFLPDVIPDWVRLWRTLIGFLPAAALVGLLEELVFRGLLLQSLLACSKPAALVASSAAYALVHLREAPVTLAAGMELAGLFFLGFVLAFSYLRTQQLYVAVGLHASLAYGARVNKLLVTVSDPSLAWLTGTSRLVNGLLGWAVLAGIGGIIARWARPPHEGGSRNA